MKVIPNSATLFGIVNNNQEVILYPSGKEGNNVIDLFRFMSFFQHQKICCIAVSKMVNENSRHFVYQAPMIQLDHLPHFRETAVFIKKAA